MSYDIEMTDTPAGDTGQTFILGREKSITINVNKGGLTGSCVNAKSDISISNICSLLNDPDFNLDEIDFVLRLNIKSITDLGNGSFQRFKSTGPNDVDRDAFCIYFTKDGDRPNPQATCDGNAVTNVKFLEEGGKVDTSAITFHVSKNAIAETIKATGLQPRYRVGFEAAADGRQAATSILYDPKVTNTASLTGAALIALVALVVLVVTGLFWVRGPSTASRRVS